MADGDAAPDGSAEIIGAAHPVGRIEDVDDWELHTIVARKTRSDFLSALQEP